MAATAGFDCEGQRQPPLIGGSEMSRRTKYAILASFGLAVLMGFVAGGLINHAMVDSTATNHGHALGKYIPAVPLGTRGTSFARTTETARFAQDAVTMGGTSGQKIAIPSKKVWVTWLDASDLKPGEVTSGFRYGQEIAIAKTTGGKLFALSNKLPPTGQPATFGTIEGGSIVEPITLTKFRLSDGKVDGTWCPSPIGRLLIGRLTTPTDVPVFPVRSQGGKIQVNINVNAKAQFESKYWRGVLDAQGKVDGGYY
jgi:nitrite reductase/ring-hydroxylating ferredoxin subunit